MIITLLSDFGMQDFSQAILKGILLEELPDAKLVDISHDVAPHHLLQCCYFLKSSYTHFPKNTIHLSLFNLFVHADSKLILTAIEGQFIISADNGLLPLTFGNDLKQVYALPFSTGQRLPNLMKQIASFLKHWDEDDFPLNKLEKSEVRKGAIPFEPYTNEDSISCQIIHIDRFGNIVLNLREDYFERHRNGREFSISFSRNNVINHLCQNYSEVPEGEKLCLFNSGGFMEIAVCRGSAAKLFGFTLMVEHQLVYNSIKITFS